MRSQMNVDGECTGKPSIFVEQRLGVRLCAHQCQARMPQVQTAESGQQELDPFGRKDKPLQCDLLVFLIRLNTLMAAHYSDPCYRVDQLAAGMHKTVRTLQRQFEAHGLGSPSEYQRCYRLHVAKSLLTNGARVGNAAANCGLDPKTFAEKFKACFGLTPYRYCRQMTANDNADTDGATSSSVNHLDIDRSI